MNRSVMGGTALISALLLAGCADTDPYRRAGQWQPTGANSLNLAAMVVNPRDLIRGHGDRASDGSESVAGVTRLWSGRVTPLPGGSSLSAPAGPASLAPPTGAP